MHYLFHIATAHDYKACAKDEVSYTCASLKKAGFIHCSLAHQVPDVLNRLFHKQRDMACLVIDPLRLMAEVRYEDLYKENQKYPHVYGPINWDSILEVVEISQGNMIPPRLKLILEWNHGTSY